MDDSKRHFCHVMLHYLKKGIKVEVTASKLCAVYEDASIALQTIFNWFRRFRAEKFSLEDEEHSERPPYTDVDILKAFVDHNPRCTLSEITDSPQILKTTIYRHFS